MNNTRQSSLSCWKTAVEGEIAVPERGVAATCLAVKRETLLGRTRGIIDDELV